MIELNQIIQICLMVAMAVAGWFMRMLWTASQTLKDDLANLRVEMPKEYIRRDDYREDLGRIHELLEKIYDKLEKKADK
jgi:hypothetical protein